MPLLRSLVLPLTTVSVCAMALCAAVPAHAGGAAYQPRQGAIFSHPTAAGPGRENVIREHLLALINHAARGSTIRAAMYLWRDAAVTEALARAKNKRGVTVQIITNNARDSKARPYFSELTKKIGNYRPGFTDGSWAGECRRSWGCLGTGIHHNKFFLFSKVGSASDVVVQSSANLTLEERTEFWNNAYTVADSGLYGAYGDYFERLREGVGRVRPPADDAYTHVVTGKHQLYTTPSVGPGDPITEVLDQVKCSTNKARPTRIRVAMFKFGLRPIAERLAALRAEPGGYCDVKLVYGMLGTTPAAIARTERLVRAGTDAARECSGKMTVHSKYLTIDAGAGSLEGVTGRKAVLTGSLNYMPFDLRRSDETVLRITDARVHDQYRIDFDAHLFRTCAKPWWEGDRTATR
ncbi:phospholipase D-like domain-containing protein [Actinocorallia sp. A-T 12471]|uniref:phospholipase D-like domain-containing protein n=1 Tax=Actinocorallia sp. A-T 12471 TaxID=3089813 RepID=UPI0029D04D2A|nr:phospholipase D-like domain-containing protein [Actinocorallia sp. A-T 12471]MDX6742540.1 phospholipase D-like domain-containing protein [Actinocorallia sp. A-T 12471]